MFKKLLITLIVGILCLSSLSFAEPSNLTITFQGRLVDAQGTPVNGTRRMAFLLFTAGGTSSVYGWHPNADATPLSQPTGYKSVNCSDGNYAVELNFANDADVEALFGDSNYDDLFLEVWVTDSDGSISVPASKMSPRIHMTGTAYALSAHQIQGLSIDRSGGNVTIEY